MLKALALTLTVAIFFVSGFTFAPADSLRPQGLTRTETFTAENLTVIPLDDQKAITLEVRRTAKTDREDKPKT